MPTVTGCAVPAPPIVPQQCQFQAIFHIVIGIIDQLPRRYSLFFLYFAFAYPASVLQERKPLHQPFENRFENKVSDIGKLSLVCPLGRPAWNIQTTKIQDARTSDGPSNIRVSMDNILPNNSRRCSFVRSFPKTNGTKSRSRGRRTIPVQPCPSYSV